MELVGSLDYAALFDQAWEEEGNTPIELPAVDVNEVLRRRYAMEPVAHLTVSSLWDMEVKKASAPDVYLPGLVRPGSVERFQSEYNGPLENFTRVSDQQLWLDSHEYGTVIEHVQLDHASRRAYFLGAHTFRTPLGRDIKAGTRQPLFHVEHSVAGTEDTPLNLWRIVSLSDGFDDALAVHFRDVAHNPYLRDFIEVYLRRDLHRDLRRLPA